MKRAEKNMQSRQNIMEYALREFAAMGYGLSSINTICNAGGISKGNLYHYFKDKDSLYLACVKDCFDALVAGLRAFAEVAGESPKERLDGYFKARFEFFQRMPHYQRLFCEAVVAPPQELAGQIRNLKAEFDNLNRSILEGILDRLDLRPDIRKEEALQVFRQYQDFITASCSGCPKDGLDAEKYEERCRRALDILLYGIVARGGQEDE